MSTGNRAVPFYRDLLVYQQGLLTFLSLIPIYSREVFFMLVER
jgi:hypothetical protein